MARTAETSHLSTRIHNYKRLLDYYGKKYGNNIQSKKDAQIKNQAVCNIQTSTGATFSLCTQTLFFFFYRKYAYYRHVKMTCSGEISHLNTETL